MADDDRPVILTLQNGDRRSVFEASYLLSWAIPSLLVGIGLTLILPKAVLKLDGLEKIGIFILMSARVAWLLFDRNYGHPFSSKEKAKDEPWLLGRIVATALFLPIAYWILKFDNIGLLGTYILVFWGGRVVSWGAELLYPLDRPQVLSPSPLGIEAPGRGAPTAAERGAIQERESKSGFAVLVLALILTAAVLTYAFISM